MRRVVTPTEEEFAAWRDNPVTQFVSAAYEAKAAECHDQWSRLFHAKLVPVDLENKRQILNAQEDVFRAFLECTLNDCLAAVGGVADALAKPKGSLDGRRPTSPRPARRSATTGY